MLKTDKDKYVRQDLILLCELKNDQWFIPNVKRALQGSSSNMWMK